MKKIIIVCLLFLFNSCHVYEIQTGIQPEKYETKRCLFPHKNLVLTSDSVKIEGFYPLNCFTAKDVFNLKKQIPKNYKNKTVQISYFSELSNKQCLGLFELCYYKIKSDCIEVTQVPFIRLNDTIVTCFRGEQIDKEVIKELGGSFEEKCIDKIVEYFNEGIYILERQKNNEPNDHHFY